MHTTPQATPTAISAGLSNPERHAIRAIADREPWADVGPRGNVGTYVASALICLARWGGGADPGCWHVFTASTAGDYLSAHLSQQCVVDSFGDLVAVSP